MALRLSRPQSISQGASVSGPKRLYELTVGLASAASAGAWASTPAMACLAVADSPYGAAADTAQSAIDAVATGDAVALIATLPPDQAEAVLLRAVLGLDAITAGQVLGKRPGAIRTAAHRGLKTLHKKLESGEGEDWRAEGVLKNGRVC